MQLKSGTSYNAPVAPPLRRKCMPLRSKVVHGRTSKHWPAAITHTRPKGLHNPLNFCYRRSMLQCLLNTPVVYNYLGNMHPKCRKIERECVVCALQALMSKYWHDRSPTNFPMARGGAVTVLDRAVKHCCVGKDAFSRWAQGVEQGDPHDYLMYLLRQLEGRQ